MKLKSAIERLQYLFLHQEWRTEITGNGAQIDESAFDEIYKMQDERNEIQIYEAGVRDFCPGRERT